MAYTVLARRYRSRTFDEVIGQDHISQTLKRAIESNRLAHAYLFCGTRGTGKTSTARIFAKCLNCESGDGPVAQPCNQCSSCQGVARGDDIDVIEIDAASNTGVDNIRELIENSQYRPARSRFKVYIIDEVHMLSKSAFNALLKTLEEPPSHVKFILATTEPEKVLPTIQSRCQRYDFRNIPSREIAGHLASICKQENIQADEDALLLVARAGAGSMRDSLSLLDRLLSTGESHLTVEHIEQMLGMPRATAVIELAGALGRGEAGRALELADTMIAGGLSPETLVASLVDHLRNLLILRVCGDKTTLVEAPGVNLQELRDQAARFMPAALSQDIVILEELRRLQRTSQSGRALLDATLVRLALAEQFADVTELLGDVSGARPDAADQKKKDELSVGSQAGFSPARSENAQAGIGDAPASLDRLSSSASRDDAVGHASAAGSRDANLSAGGGETSSSFSRTGGATGRTAVPTPPVHSTDDGDAASMASAADEAMAEMSRLPHDGPGAAGSPVATARHVAATMSAASSTSDVADDRGNASPATGGIISNATGAFGGDAVSSAMTGQPMADERDLPAVWKQLQRTLADGGGMLVSGLGMARLESIQADEAVIRFSPNGETFARTWTQNGKRTQIGHALTSVLGRNIAVRFEVDTEEQTARAPATTEQTAAARPAAQSRSGGSVDGEESAAQPAMRSSISLTQDVMARVKSNPLVTAILTELGGEVVRLVEEQ